jgi:DNA repair exonuclease SbcCD ATPase subunit
MSEKLSEKMQRGFDDDSVCAGLVFPKGWIAEAAALEQSLAAKQEEIERLKNAYSKSADEVEQSLGKALGYPWFKDDQKNFPGATKADGVCVGDHVPESIADEAAKRITDLQEENAALRAEVQEIHARLKWARETSKEVMEENRTLREALTNLCDRLDFVEEDERYKGVWTACAIRGYPYNGPTWEQAYKEARAALSATPKPSEETPKT